MMESLRVTLLPVLDINEELLALGGTLYVLRAKLNQPTTLEVINATRHSYFIKLWKIL